MIEEQNMEKHTEVKRKKYGQRVLRLAAVMLAVLVAVSYMPWAHTYAASKVTKSTGTKKSETTTTTSVDSEIAIREVHKIKVGKKRYCFFVTHNVILTPAEIAEFGDDDGKLTDEVLKRAGLYMKEENCKLASHTAITPKAWKKAGGTLSLGEVEIYEEAGESEAAGAADTDGSDNSDGTAAEAISGGSLNKVPGVEALRKAAPTDGDPARFYMDLIITDETPKKGSSKEPEKYTTFKRKSPNSPKLIYIAVATEADAALGETICEEPKTKTKKSQTSSPASKSSDGDEEEKLPEYRTINMTDRSGGPLEPTLEDGDPVTLEWIDSGKQTDSEGKAGISDHAWVIPAVIAALAIAAAVVLILRKRRSGEEEQ